MSHPLRFSIGADQLHNARRLSHSVVQWASRAARANLAAADDDSHSSLSFHRVHNALLSQGMGAGGSYQIGFSFSDLALLWLSDGAVHDVQCIRALTDPELGAWCDQRLASHGLAPTGEAVMPYAVEALDYAQFQDSDIDAELACLAAWYAWADEGLEALVATHGSAAITLPAIRCWPHHFDLATLFVLEEGDPETARSVGVGLSPGDGSYAEPYLYCTPWPTPSSLPEAPSPWSWHSEGFTSLVCVASAIAADTDREALLTEAFTAA